ncbi:hypothetical protein IWW34DRAFT_390633 [Fusarium oxysporum f. sp. albedinis]|nr:hypothetical protein IWW34DRAFT_390633 [Fusarium oxysporum f. sp. albedinis]
MFISVLIASSYAFSLCVPPSGISILLIRPRTGQDISVGPKGNYPGFNAGSRGLSLYCNAGSHETRFAVAASRDGASRA